MSWSREQHWEKCPYAYRLAYVDGYTVLPSGDPKDARATGTLVHRIIEGSPDAIWEYSRTVGIYTQESEYEVLKAERMAQKVPIPDGARFETRVERDGVVGFIDLLWEDEEGVHIRDFKYSSNPDRYRGSGQAHVYGWLLGGEVRDVGYIVIPRIMIRQRKDETDTDFRRRLEDTLRDCQPTEIVEEYDPEVAWNWLDRARQCEKDTEYPKNRTRLCEWCDFKQFCLTGDDTMLLPKNERRTPEQVTKKKIWIYGAPFAGKTYLANTFPDVLMLNTDGNIRFVDAPYILIKDEIRMEGRITKRTPAWEVFKDAISELEKKQNDYKTIVVDLVEDLYEACRIWSYQKLGIEHESDNSFKAYDYVRTQFLSTMKRLVNLDYDIILISQEDASRDITRRTGDKITSIKPNLPDKVAVKVAGMMDIVGRLVSEDGKRTISLKQSEVVFGGGRITTAKTQIPAEYSEILSLYDQK